VIAGALALVACSREAALVPPTVALQRPSAPRVDFVLHHAARSEYVAPPGRALAIPEPVAPWIVDGGIASVVDGRLHIAVRPGAQKVTLQIPGPNDLRRVGDLSVRVHAPAQRRLEVSVAPIVSDAVVVEPAVVASEFDDPDWRVFRGHVFAD